MKISLFGVLSLISFCNGHILEGLYCGKDNCYDLLNSNKDSTKQEISRNYRQLAKKYHPDVHKGSKAKQENEDMFKRIARAYEILRDEGSRLDYNYMLDHPNEYYSHFYRYYRRHTTVDIRIVILVCITIVSVVQYITRMQRYEGAIKYFMTVPKYRNRAIQMVNDADFKKASSCTLRRSAQKEESEKNIRRILEQNLDIQGAYAKPRIADVLWVKIICLPYTIYKLLEWNIMWIYKFSILRRPYGNDEKLYLIRKNMNLGVHQFKAIDSSKIEEYIEKELWMKNKYVTWKSEQEGEVKRQMADNPRYKAYRRYMKNRGPNRITFDD